MSFYVCFRNDRPVLVLAAKELADGWLRSMESLLAKTGEPAAVYWQEFPVEYKWGEMATAQ